MKILAIRGCNLASLAGEFEIDLSRGPLSGAGVFAIVGNTGAGKSTLLDALCVALFDRTPRLTNHSTVKVGRGLDDKALLGAQDVRTLLRRGTSQGWAEVDFESGDARQYRARWSVRRARGQSDGTLQDEQLSLTAIEGGERFGGTKTETLKAIHARLGLSFDQFRRSALLAQGEFAAFLRADGKDRSELLERMTGTQIYSRLSIAAHVKATLAEQRLRDGRIAALAIPVLDDAAEREAQLALEAATGAAVLARRRHAAAAQVARWLAEAATRGQALAAVEAEHAAARAGLVAAEGDRAELLLRRRAELLRPAWDEAARLERGVAVAAGEVTAAGAAVARAAAELAAIAERRATLAAMQAPVRAARIAAGIVERAAADRAEPIARTAIDDAAWLAGRGALAPEIAAWPELDARFAHHGALGEAIATLDRALTEQVAARAKLAKAHKVAAGELQAATRKHEDAKRKAASFAQKRGLTLDAARRLEDEARTRLAQVERLVTLAQAARAASERRDEIDHALGELMLVDDPAVEAAEALATERQAIAKRRLEDARATRHQTEAATKAAQDAQAEVQLCQVAVDHLASKLGELDRRVAELDAAIGHARGERISKAEQHAALARALAAAMTRWLAALPPEDATSGTPIGAGATSGAGAGAIAGEGEIDPAFAIALVARLTASAPSRHAPDVMPSAPLPIVRIAMLAVVTAWRERADRIAHADAALSAAAAAVEHEAREVDRAVAEHTARRGDAERRRDALDGERAAAMTRLAAARGEAGFEPDELRRLLSADPSRVDALAERLAALDRAVERTRVVVAERARQVADHAAARPAHDEALASPGEPAAPVDATVVEALAVAVTAAEQRAAQLRAVLAADEQARARRASALAGVAADEAGAEVDRILGDVIGSHDGKLFRSFAQSLTLDGLLAVANAHLEELAPRYQLERVPRHDLELQVIDRDLGSEVRSVQSLSGGESFLVSLALALGLSSMSAHDVRVRTLLIDEGFGTLDPATLDSALSVLDALQATGRQVGVISHVPALVERVGAHVRVVQRGGGRSEVIVA